MKLYALLDKKSGAYSAYQVQKFDAAVSRDFAQAVLQKDSLLGKYPDDFELVRLGQVPDGPDEDGEFMLVGESILSARQVIDLQPRAGVEGDPAQLALIKEA